MGEALTFVNFGVTGHLRIDRNLGLFIHLGGVDRGSEKYLLEEIWMQCTCMRSYSTTSRDGSDQVFIIMSHKAAHQG